MKNSQKAELLRKFRPKSLCSITEKKESNKVEFAEFNNYKSLQLLDPPANFMVDCLSSTKLSKSSQFLFRKEVNFNKLPIDFNYIAKHIEIARHMMKLASIDKIKNLRCRVPEKFKPKQLFLDIDETLCYTYNFSKKSRKETILEGKAIISTRPWACEFIQRISEHYDIIVPT